MPSRLAVPRSRRLRVPVPDRPGVPADQRTDYARHVDQMIRQVLLTAPGERVDLPQFGCGLRQLVFAPRPARWRPPCRSRPPGSLSQWLAGVIDVGDVTSCQRRPAATSSRARSQVTISYTLLDTLTSQSGSR